MDRASCLIVLCAVFGVLVNFSAAQTEHVVGGAIGWTVPPNRDAYATWASNIIFRVNDTLVFNFTTGRHDVLQVPSASYTACTQANPIGSNITFGPATIVLNDTGIHYYICTFSNHCSLGQRLNITVVRSSGGANPPATAPTTPETPPPASTQPGGPTFGAGGPAGAMPSPDNSASTSLAAGFLVTVLAAGIALIC